MRILAIEFSSPQRSVAVVCRSARSRLALSEVVETGGRHGNPIGMIDTALREAHLDREQIDCVAVGLGPGSYTGIRLAIALAQGWLLGSNNSLKLAGISSAELVAAQAAAEFPPGPAHIVIDAQRQEFYLGTYELGPDEYHEREPLRLVSLAEMRRLEPGGERFFGPEVTRWFPNGTVLSPRAAVLGSLALDKTESVESLEPIYLRATTFVKAPPARNICS